MLDWLWDRRTVIGFVILALGNVAGWVSLEAEQDARLAEQMRTEAHRCLADHREAMEVREAISVSAQIPAEALVTVVGEDASPETVERYRVLVEEGINRAVAEIEDPECSLVAAEETLGQ